MTWDETAVARLARAFRADTLNERPRQECPPAEKIWSAVREELAPGELRRLLDHIAVCGLCTEAWLLAEQLEAPHRHPVAAKKPESARRGWLASGTASGQRWAAAARVATASLRGSWLPAAVAATLLVVAAAVVVQVRTVPAPSYRTLPDGEIELLTDATVPLPREDCHLRWSGPEGAGYSLRILHGFDEVVFEVGRQKETELTVPAQKLAALPAGARLDLYLEAHLPDGRGSINRTFSFSLR